MIPRLVNKFFVIEVRSEEAGRCRFAMNQYGLFADVNGKDVDVFPLNDKLLQLGVVVPTGATPSLVMPNPLSGIAEVVITHQGNEIVRRKDVYSGQAVGVVGTQLQRPESDQWFYIGEVVFSFTPQDIDNDALESALQVLERHAEQCFTLLGTVPEPRAAAKSMVEMIFRKGEFNTHNVKVIYMNRETLEHMRHRIASGWEVV